MFHFRNRAETIPNKKVVAIVWQPHSPALLQSNLNNSRQIKYISHSVLAIVRNCTIQFICANKESHHTIYRNVIVCFCQDIKLPFPWIPAFCAVVGSRKAWLRGSCCFLLLWFQFKLYSRRLVF